MKTVTTIFTILVSCIAVQAQTITPIFEFLTGQDTPIEILVAQDLDADNPGAWQDGTLSQDTYMGLEPYPDGRYLLGVRTNGINEAVDGHDAELSAMYPDFSLIWLDANGNYDGIALTPGQAPIPLSDEWVTENGEAPAFTYVFAVDDEGVVYYAYGNQIVRYAPDGSGGFSEPTLAFTLSSEITADLTWEPFGTGILVEGSGSDTIIALGGVGYYALSTSDGLTYEVSGTIPTGWGNSGGGFSIPIEQDGTEFVYASWYGWNSSGIDSRFNRWFKSPGTADPYERDDPSLFALSGFDEEGLGYQGRFVAAIGAHPELDYIVVHSTPSYNSLALGIDPPSPGYLGVHLTNQFDLGGIDGAVDSFYEIDVTEAVGDNRGSVADKNLRGQFHATMGKVILHHTEEMADGASFVIWSNYQYGFGVYGIGDTNVNEWSLY